MDNNEQRPKILETMRSAIGECILLLGDNHTLRDQVRQLRLELEAERKTLASLRQENTNLDTKLKEAEKTILELQERIDTLGRGGGKSSGGFLSRFL